MILIKTINCLLKKLSFKKKSTFISFYKYNNFEGKKSTGRSHMTTKREDNMLIR